MPPNHQGALNAPLFMHTLTRSISSNTHARSHNPHRHWLSNHNGAWRDSHLLRMPADPISRLNSALEGRYRLNLG